MKQDSIINWHWWLIKLSKNIKYGPILMFYTDEDYFTRNYNNENMQNFLYYVAKENGTDMYIADSVEEAFEMCQYSSTLYRIVVPFKKS